MWQENFIFVIHIYVFTDLFCLGDDRNVAELEGSK